MEMFSLCFSGRPYSWTLGGALPYWLWDAGFPFRRAALVVSIKVHAGSEGDALGA